jgi:peptidyl-prolyl cis-trans isomerase C
MRNRKGIYKTSIGLIVAFIIGCLFGCAGVNRDKPVATIDGESVITAGDYLYHYHRALDKAPPKNKPVINTLDDARAFLDNLIIGRVLELEAEARGFDDDPVFKRDVVIHRSKILRNMLMEDVIAEVTVTDDDVKEYFDRVTHPRYVSLIATKTKADADKAKEALDAGTPFEEVVKKFSEDSATRKAGGRNPEPFYYKTVPAYDAVFELKNKGDYTDVVYREFYDMFFIYRYDGDAEPIKEEYEKEEDRLRKKLEKYRAEEIISGDVEKLRDGVKVKRNADVYDDVLSLPPAEVEKKHYHSLAVIAEVGETPIYFDDFWEHFVYKLNFSGINLDAFRRSDPEGFKEAVEKALDVFVREALKEVEAEKRGITEREEFVREMNRFRGVKLIDMMNKEVFIPTIPKVTDEEIVAYFNAHKNSYAVPEAMEGNCIIMKDRDLTEELYAVAGKEGFKTAADKAFTHLTGEYGEANLKGPSPPTRDELVTHFVVTKDPSYRTGGAEEPEYLTLLRKYVYDYPEGALSPVIDLGDGRYLLFHNDKYTAYKERSLDDEGVYKAVKRDAQIEVNMSDETDRRSREWFESLKAKHDVEVDEGVLKSIFKEIQKEKG